MDCRHQLWEITEVRDGKVFALCRDCDSIICTTIFSFSEDYQGLLYSFTQDVCSGCGQRKECFEGEESPMPGLIPSGIGCTKGVKEILAIAF